MRTLSARILLGFIALTITFGVFAATMVMNLGELEDEARILQGQVRLATASSDLAIRHAELKNYLEQGLPEAAGPAEVDKTIERFRKNRDAPLNEIINQMEILDSLVTPHGQAADGSTLFPATLPKVIELKKAIAQVDELYTVVVATPPLRVPRKSDPSFQAHYDGLDAEHKRAHDTLLRLRETEASLTDKITGLKIDRDRFATVNRERLATMERTIIIRTIYLGIFAVVLGVVITAWVAVMLRPLRRLREGARRIAAGDYGKRVSETGPSEIADLAREFNSMGRAVQEREEEKLRAARLAMVGKMAAQIAHEVRNPLSSIGLNTELLEDELHQNETARELCRAIHTEVNRLTEVTEIYLGLRGGKPKLARESLNAIIEDLVDFVRHDLATRCVELETELDPQDPTGYIDANQIRQCLINLVRNAADAVSAKGGGSVVLRTRSERSRVEIAVEDDGVGIASDLLPRLFDPFFSTKEGGTGLGLALTQQIIHDHGGDIHVASRVGRGTTFTLSVPAG